MDDETWQAILEGRYKVDKNEEGSEKLGEDKNSEGDKTDHEYREIGDETKSDKNTEEEVKKNANGESDSKRKVENKQDDGQGSNSNDGRRGDDRGSNSPERPNKLKVGDEGGNTEGGGEGAKGGADNGTKSEGKHRKQFSFQRRVRERRAAKASKNEPK